MFVEKLELFGFKSFVHRTEVPLARGITAIVGPNGCGKSNLSDALRWVLGEQNARTLRGERIQDVIFKGTKTTKPLGMAEVSLSVSNDDGRLPLEYSHVAVVRRVFRSGESEFAINKVPCRLKDIRDLFSGTGLGSHGYAVIERDMIDQVLSDKDDARRFLFEEAAGIIRYKQRRKESERRLEGVEQDLTRIEDMIREIERGVRSLARQAGKVRRWRRFKEEHDAISIRLAWERWKLLRDQSLSTEEMHRRRETQRADLSTAVTVLEAKREAQRMNLLELADRLEQAQRGADAASRAVQSAQEEERVLRARCEAWGEEEKDLRLRLERQGRRQGELEAEREEIVPRCEELRRRLEEAEGSARAAAALRTEAETGLREIRSFLAEAQQTNLDLNASRSGSRQELESKGERRAAAIQRLESLEQHLLAFAERDAQVGRDLKEAEGRLQKIEEELRERAAACASLQEQREGQKTHEAGLGKSLIEAEQTRAARASRLDLLDEQRQRHAGFDAAVRHLLDNRGEFPGLLGVAGEEIRLRPGAEILGRALLGERVQWVLVQDEEAAFSAMGRLRELGLGGVTFFPLREAGVHPSPAGAGRWSQGWMGPEVDLEQAVVDLFDSSGGGLPFLLSIAAGTRLAGSIEEARAVNAGRGVRLLTAQGDLFEGDGTLRLTGGEREEIEILRREQEIPELRRDLEELDRTIAGRTEELSALRGRDRDWASQIQRLDELSSGLDQERARLAEARTAGRTELAMLREEGVRLGQERDRTRAELALLAEDLARLAEVVDRSQVDTEQARDRFQELVRASEEQERIKDDRVRSAAEREMECLRLRNDLAAQEAELRNREREAAELSRSLTEASARLQERSGEAEQAGARIQELARNKAELEGRREAGEAGFARAKEGHGAAQDLLFQLDGEIRAQREKLDALVQALHAEDVERLQVRGQADQIRDRIREEHGVDLEIYSPPPEPVVRPRRRRPAREKIEEGAVPGAGPGEAEAIAAEELESLELGEEDEEFEGEDLEPGMGEEAELGGAVTAEEAPQTYDPLARMNELRRALDNMGNLNFLAEEEYRASRERLDFHRKQSADLTQARTDLLEAIRRINETAGQMFEETFRIVQENFIHTFDRLFPGGEATINLASGDPLEGDIEISARPRGKRLESIRLLSSGERALTAIALLFAIYLAKPSPVCLLDEVDAPLDDANLDRFLSLVRHFSERTQFVVITHNKKTMETADRLFGVTMEEPGISKIVSVQLDGGAADIAGLAAASSLPGGGPSPIDEPAGS